MIVPIRLLGYVANRLYIHIYIYMYMCVCVCVCVYNCTN